MKRKRPTRYRNNRKKTRPFLRSLFVRKKINLVPTIPSLKLHLGYRSANHQFIAWSRNVLKHLRWIGHTVREEPNVLESFFNVFPSTLYPGLCFKMRRTFPFKYQLIAKTIEFISMVPRKMCNWNACTAKETNFRKKVMASAVITWRGVSQPFVIGGNGIKWSLLLEASLWWLNPCCWRNVSEQRFHIRAR